MPQKLAAFLNVGVTSIYWYFKSKRELLDAMTEEAAASFYESMPPLRGDSWEEMLREFFVSFYALLAGDELRCDLIVRRIGNHPERGSRRLALGQGRGVARGPGGRRPARRRWRGMPSSRCRSTRRATC